MSLKMPNLYKASIVLSCLILSCSATNCPKCPENNLPCHKLFIISTPCACYGCLTRCFDRVPVCPKGEVCTTKSIYFGNSFIGRTAVCRPFERCLKIMCPVNCPESGYLVDINGCSTCLCNDPCKELKCTMGCWVSNTIPGSEAIYKCK